MVGWVVRWDSKIDGFSVLPALRRSTSLAALLTLALVAGPAASALCPHADADDMAHGTDTAHEAPMEAMSHGDAAPCHEPPPPASDDGADCISACCATDGPRATVAPILTVTVDVPTVPVTVRVEPATAPAPPAVPAEPSPPPGRRLHVEFERFLI